MKPRVLRARSSSTLLALGGKSRVTTRIYGEGQHTQSVDVRGFSSEERASIDLNTVMTFELHDALCTSASRARVQRL
jgi:hypothetical protein